MHAQDGKTEEGHSLKVMKFGGSSVGSVARLRQAVQIVRRASSSEQIVVVVSALSGVTRRLVVAVEKLRSGASDGRKALAELRGRHREQAADLLAEEAHASYEATLDERLAGLETIFSRARSEGVTPALRDAVLATGEQLSVPLFAAALSEAGLDAAEADATRLIRTDDAHGAAHVDRGATARQVRTWQEELPESHVPVVAGFIGATGDGAPTTLGFEGSDYSAALLAALLNAGVLERWTDVDGLYTADPDEDPNARPIDRLAMEEALKENEAGHLGMHPRTLRPLLDAGIPLRIRSVAAPEGAGTWISPAADREEANREAETGRRGDRVIA